MTAAVFRPLARIVFDRSPTGGAPDRLKTYAAIAGLSFTAYILARLVDGPAGTALAAFGVSACGWSWLLARALFDPSVRDAGWPRVVVAVLTASGAATVLAPEGGVLGEVARNLYVLSGSAALLLTFVEPFQRHGCVLTPADVRFRAAFVAVFALLVGASVLAAWAAPQRVEAACAVVGLLAAAGAVAFRLRHPLARGTRPADRRRTATAEDLQLAERLERLLREEAIHLDPDLRLAEVAARLDAPEHRISRCVSAGLGFANFNRLINHHRIEAARRRLEAQGEDRPILHIALDSGFASVGPFNRAFRAETGMTPRAYRALKRSGAA